VIIEEYLGTNKLDNNVFYKLIGIMSGETHVAKAPINCPNDIITQTKLAYIRWASDKSNTLISLAFMSEEKPNISTNSFFSRF